MNDVLEIIIRIFAPVAVSGKVKHLTISTCNQRAMRDKCEYSARIQNTRNTSYRPSATSQLFRNMNPITPRQPHHQLHLGSPHAHLHVHQYLHLYLHLLPSQFHPHLLDAATRTRPHPTLAPRPPPRPPFPAPRFPPSLRYRRHCRPVPFDISLAPQLSQPSASARPASTHTSTTAETPTPAISPTQSPSKKKPRTTPLLSARPLPLPRPPPVAAPAMMFRH